MHPEQQKALDLFVGKKVDKVFGVVIAVDGKLSIIDCDLSNIERAGMMYALKKYVDLNLIDMFNNGTEEKLVPKTETPPLP